MMGVGYVVDVILLNTEVRKLRSEVQTLRNVVNALSIRLERFRSEVEGLGTRLSLAQREAGFPSDVESVVESLTRWIKSYSAPIPPVIPQTTPRREQKQRGEGESKQ